MTVRRNLPLVMFAVLCLLAALTLSGCQVGVVTADDNWPQWRGAGQDGTVEDANLPTSWSETENILWKVDLPGKGSSTPIVWENRIYVQTAVSQPAPPQPQSSAPEQGGRRRGPRGTPPTPTAFKLLALNLEDGSQVWEKTLLEKIPHEGTHPTGTFASNSPVTDGEHIYAYFGSNGLYCLDMEGNLKWQKDLGDMRIRLGFGEGTSPALYGETLVILWDHEDDSFIVALNKEDGSEKWRVSRDEPTSWSTPLMVEHEGRVQVITGATNRVRSYDLENGELIWEDNGLTVNPIPTPVYEDGVVYVTSGFRGSVLRAVDLSKAKGDIEGTDAVLWSYDQDTPYVPSPLLYKGSLYIIKVNNAILTNLNAATGEPFYARQRLEGLNTIYSSPIAAGDRIYIFDREGNSVVLKQGTEFELLATNQLDDGFDASPAIIGNTFLMRGHENLYRIGATQ